MFTDKRKDFSLVVRVWQVKDRAGEMTWRGSIECVPSKDGRPIYFQSLERMFEVIEEILNNSSD